MSIWKLLLFISRDYKYKIVFHIHIISFLNYFLFSQFFSVTIKSNYTHHELKILLGEVLNAIEEQHMQMLSNGHAIWNDLHFTIVSIEFLFFQVCHFCLYQDFYFYLWEFTWIETEEIALQKSLLMYCWEIKNVESIRELNIVSIELLTLF